MSQQIPSKYPLQVPAVYGFSVKPQFVPAHLIPLWRELSKKLRIAGERAEVLLHRSICASHVIHQDDCVRDLVQVHADGRLDVEVDADAAAVAGLGCFQVPTQVGGDEVRSVRYSVK